MQYEYVWEDIWQNDSYSDPAERVKRAERRAALIQTLLGGNQNLGEVIELGCGDGSLSHVLSSRHDWSIRRYVGIDRSHTAIARATLRHQTFETHEFCQADVSRIDLPKASADTVIACGLLEHLPEIRQTLKTIHSSCRSDSKVILTMSNTMSMMYVHRKIRESFGLWPYGYQKNYTPTELTSLLGELFSIDQITVTHGDWDFPFVAAIDRFTSLFQPDVGRYIAVVCSPKY